VKLDFLFSLRLKLYVVALTLFGIPWSGYFLLTEVESYLRMQQEESLVNHAHTIQQVMVNSSLNLRKHNRGDLFVHQWDYPIYPDGYGDDWVYLDAEFYETKDPESNFGFRIAVGEDISKRYLVLLLDVDTEPVKYSRFNENQVVMYFSGHHFRFNPMAPGRLTAEQSVDDQWVSTDASNAIVGAWQDKANGETGYRLEAKIPRGYLKQSFGVRVETTYNRKIRTVDPIERGTLRLPEPRLEELAALHARNKMRVRVIDDQGWKLADVNRMSSDVEDSESDGRPWIIRDLLRSIMPAKYFPDYPYANNSKLPTDHFFDLHYADFVIERFHQESTNSTIVAASKALVSRSSEGEERVGTILIEQDTDQILSFQDRALQNIVLMTIALFTLTGAMLYLFSSSLTKKVKGLKEQLEHSVSHDGRITGQMKPSASRDELGELGRGIDSVLRRLSEYNQYLEAMASRLAHELRTPLTVVKTSVDNARMTATEDQAKYLDRAVSGADRLDDILKRLREASRLEHALQDTEIVSFSMTDLVNRQIEVYQSVWPDISINIEVVGQIDSIIGAPEIVVQALEKLMSNAVDFREADTAITIKVEREKELVSLSVINQGPSLPEEDIFASMVSKRKSTSNQPHLGLGLYIVRLVADYHRGYAFAQNLSGGVEVGFKLKI
jgi:two-component system sensor histidine kinase ChvG